MKLLLKDLGVRGYEGVLNDMKTFTKKRTSDTPDEVWALQHMATYTLGRTSAEEDLLCNNQRIPLVRSDRGGKITYHAPGQIILYILLDLKRRGIKVRTLVRLLENAVIQLLDDYKIKAVGSVTQPGVYVNNAKIASLGLRIKNNCCYHGLALNVKMDLSPFANINICGYSGLKVTQLLDLGVEDSLEHVKNKLITKLFSLL